jgi:hypothetical protein
MSTGRPFSPRREQTSAWEKAGAAELRIDPFQKRREFSKFAWTHSGYKSFYWGPLGKRYITFLNCRANNRQSNLDQQQQTCGLIPLPGDSWQESLTAFRIIFSLPRFSETMQTNGL